MSDLHAALLEAITARQERAQAATPGPWSVRKGDRLAQGCRCLSCYEDWPEAWIIPEIDGPPGADASPTIYHHDAAFIAAESPDDVLRQCERDLKVLARHVPSPAFTERPVCHACRRPGYMMIELWPCSEITDLADAYAIPVDATAGQTPGGTG